MNVLTTHCPVCGGKMPNKVLVCEHCWPKIPTVDRGQFYTMYHANPTKPQCWESKAKKIIRELKARPVTKTYDTDKDHGKMAT